jgi:hypothetical protein
MNDAVVRKEIREVVMLSTEGNKIINLTVIDFVPSEVMETSLGNGTLDFVINEYKELNIP